MGRSLSEYLRRVAHYWWVLVVGAAGGVAGIVSLVTGWSLPTWLWVTVLLAGVVVAQFLAFHDLFKERPAWPPPGKGLRGWKAAHVWSGQPQPNVFLWLLPPSGASDDDTVRCEVTSPSGDTVVSLDDPVQRRQTGEYGVWYPLSFSAPITLMDGTYTVVWYTRRDVPGIRMLRKHRFRVRDGQPERGAAPPVIEKIESGDSP